MIWQIQQPKPWVTSLAWSVWMIHFVDLGHRNSWLRHLDATQCESSGSNKFQFVRTISKLKVSYTTANHCTKYPCWGWCWNRLVLMLRNEEWKGSFLHFRSCGAQRALGRMRSPLRIQKPFLFSFKSSMSQVSLQGQHAVMPMCCSFKGWIRLTVFSMHSAIPKGATSSTVAHGYPLNHRQAKDKTLMGGSFEGGYRWIFVRCCLHFEEREGSSWSHQFQCMAWNCNGKKTPTARQVGKHLPLSGAEVSSGELGCKACFSSIIEE